MTSHSDLDIEFPHFTLEEGQMIIWSDALTSLQEELRYRIDRAKYYGEGEMTPAQFIELMQGLEARVIQLKKTNQGEA